jgi:hypothetical protein
VWTHKDSDLWGLLRRCPNSMSLFRFLVGAARFELATPSPPDFDAGHKLFACASGFLNLVPLVEGLSTFEGIIPDPPLRRRR